MKIFSLSFIPALLFNLCAFCQNIGVPALTLDDEQIITTNKTIEEIRSAMDSYRKSEKHKNASGFEAGYYKGGELQLIKTYYKDTISEKTSEWYFQNGKMIYSLKLWTDVKTKDTLDYERYYLSNERMIAWFKFDKSVSPTSVPFKKLNYMMRDYIGDLKLEYVK